LIHNKNHSPNFTSLAPPCRSTSNWLSCHVWFDCYTSSNMSVLMVL